MARLKPTAMLKPKVTQKPAPMIEPKATMKSMARLKPAPMMKPMAITIEISCSILLLINLKLPGIRSFVTVGFSQRQETPFTSFGGLKPPETLIFWQRASC